MPKISSHYCHLQIFQIHNKSNLFLQIPPLLLQAGAITQVENDDIQGGAQEPVIELISVLHYLPPDLFRLVPSVLDIISVRCDWDV